MICSYYSKPFCVAGTCGEGGGAATPGAGDGGSQPRRFVLCRLESRRVWLLFHVFFLPKLAHSEHVTRSCLSLRCFRLCRKLWHRRRSSARLEQLPAAALLVLHASLLLSGATERCSLSDFARGTVLRLRQVARRIPESAFYAFLLECAARLISEQTPSITLQ